MIDASYPARQRNRRLARGLEEALAAVASAVVAGAAVSIGIPALALMLVGLGLVFAGRCWYSLQLARRSSIGARSEQRVRDELHALQCEGWRIRHSLPWAGGGDIDHVAIAPSRLGLAFAIETKTRAYRPADLARISSVSSWLVRRRSSWCRAAAIPVLCLAGVHGVERWEDGVVVVSADRLVSVLRRLGGTTAKPGFLR